MDLNLEQDEYIVHEYSEVSRITKDDEHCIETLTLTNKNIFYLEEEGSTLFKTNYVLKKIRLSEIKIVDGQVQVSCVKDSSFGHIALVQCDKSTTRFCMDEDDVVSLVNAVLDMLGGDIEQVNYAYKEVRIQKDKAEVEAIKNAGKAVMTGVGVTAKFASDFAKKQYEKKEEQKIKNKMYFERTAMAGTISYCKRCGTELLGNQMYCPTCGLPKNESVGQQEFFSQNQTFNSTPKDLGTREISFEGKIPKCPNCGEVLKAFEIKCPTCGYEIRNNESSNSVRRFAEEIRNIERSRPNINYGKQRIKFWFDTRLDKADEEIISLIKNYPVPNNKEDIFEFISLAMSNINYNSLVDNLSYSRAESLKSEAWLNKVNQIYTKAEVLITDEIDHQKLTQMYNEVFNRKRKAEEEHKKEDKREHRKTLGLLIATFGGLIAFAVLIGIIAEWATKKTITEYETKIEMSLSNSDYDEALLYAEQFMLEGDSESKLEAKRNIRKIIKQAYSNNVMVHFVPFDSDAEIDDEDEKKEKESVELFVKKTIEDFYSTHPLEVKNK